MQKTYIVGAAALLAAGVLIGHTAGNTVVAPTIAAEQHAAAADIVMAKATPEVQAEIEAMVHKFGAMMSDLKGPRPSRLFDQTNSPLYLAEENVDWAEGVEQLLWYHDTPERLAFVDALDYQSSNFRVRMLATDLTLVTWNIHAEQKMRNGRPWAEYFRANAILRNTKDGWKFVYYAEAPRSAMAYVRELYERMASPEFRAKYPGPEDKVGK